MRLGSRAWGVSAHVRHVVAWTNYARVGKTRKDSQLMANHYRILIVVFAHESQPMQSFLDALKSGGWRAHVEIPVPHEGQCGLNTFLEQTEPPTCGACERRAWGSMLFPDIRILTQEGVSEIDDCR